MIIIIIGLPASGKTYYYNENFKDNYILYDDFITTLFNGDLINDIKKNKDICMIDPRLCNYDRFLSIISIIEQIIDKRKIKLILFKNDKINCLINARKRNELEKNKIVDKSIEFYSNIYDLNNYNHYNYEIIDVYKH